MADEDPDAPRGDREEPVGAPVVRGDPEITGAHAERAVRFDPDDPGSLAEAAETVREFASGGGGTDDQLYVLRGAAACAALVRGEGSYKAAAERAGENVTVGFLRKWARVHDLPISIRRRIATGDIAPSAAKHVARLTGDTRFLLAWAALDNDLTVDEVRMVASAVNDGTPIEAALREQGGTLGRLTVTLPPDVYRELRRHASLADRPADEVVAEALEAWLDDHDPRRSR